MKSLILIFVFSLVESSWTCPTGSSSSKKIPTLMPSDWSQKEMVKRTPSATPSFGGAKSDFWTSEARFANVGEKFLDEMKSVPDVKDIWVSIPVTLEGSTYYPFGDKQSNSRIHFPDWKDPNTLPYLAALFLFNDPARSPEIEIRLPSGVTTKKFKVSILNANPSEPKEKDYDVISLGTSGTQPTLRFNLAKANTKEKLEIFSGAKGFWITGEGWGDGFPILFKANAWRNILKKKGQIFPSLEEDFAGRNFFGQGVSNFDPENISVAPPKRPIISFWNAKWKYHEFKGPTGFAMKGKNIGRFEGYPPKPVPRSPAFSVHGEFKSDFETPTVGYTSVGGVLTSLAENGKKNASVKHLYTCFTARTPDLELVRQPSPGIPPGVPSGAGWHKVGDPAETVMNSLEAAPILTAVGTENPFKGKKFSFGLSSVATLRWTAPGEAFVTSRGEHHWYAVHDVESPVCTEILVHDCVPNDTNGLGMKCL
jgi:hypothetical protein